MCVCVCVRVSVCEHYHELIFHIYLSVCECCYKLSCHVAPPLIFYFKLLCLTWLPGLFNYLYKLFREVGTGLLFHLLRLVDVIYINYCISFFMGYNKLLLLYFLYNLLIIDWQG